MYGVHCTVQWSVTINQGSSLSWLNPLPCLLYIVTNSFLFTVLNTILNTILNTTLYNVLILYTILYTVLLIVLCTILYTCTEVAGLDGLIPEEEKKFSSSLKCIVTWDFILQVMLHCNIHYTAHKPSTFMYRVHSYVHYKLHYTCTTVHYCTQTSGTLVERFCSLRNTLIFPASCIWY